MPKRITQNDLRNQGRGPVVVLMQRFKGVVNDTLVVLRQPPTQSIPQHLAGQVRGELVFPVQQNLLEFGWPAEGLTGRQRTGRIHWQAVIVVAPTAYRVEILQSETNGVHAFMARGALGIRTMRHQSLA